MATSCWLFACLSAAILAVTEAAAVPPTHYRAAVVQCAGRGNHSDPPITNLKLVATLIEKFVKKAADNDAQIVVLPEALGWGNGIDWDNLTLGRMQAVEYSARGEILGTVPCQDRTLGNGSWWHSASCAAQQSGVVVVLNALHTVQCTSPSICPSDGQHVFNSEVAFDEHGRVVGLYHKSHIWGTAPILNEPERADPTSFETSFGVTFGMFVCYDLEFTDWLKPLLDRGIRHFVFSTNWEVNPPPLFAIHMLQQGFSRAHNSALLASNMDTPGGSGSGIFHSGEVLAVYFNSSNEAAGISDDRMLVANVPKAVLPDDAPSVTTFRKQRNRHSGVICQYEQNSKGNPTFWGGNATDVNFGRCVFATDQLGKQTLVAEQGPVRCEADVRRVASAVESDANSKLVLFAASDSFSVHLTPDPETIQACAMFLCKQTNSTEDNVVCDTLWSASSNDGSVDLIELRGWFSPNGTVIPMAAADEMTLLPPTRTPFSMEPQPTLKVNLDDSQKLYSAVLYTQFQ